MLCKTKDCSDNAKGRGLLRWIKKYGGFPMKKRKKK